jgi:ATP-dependent 26S proteasome regulatory subunit
MKRLMATIGLSGALLMGGFAAAIEPANRSPAAKRQILECMTRRMSADRAISYNEAMKACKDRVLVGKLALTSNGPTEPAGKSH